MSTTRSTRTDLRAAPFRDFDYPRLLSRAAGGGTWLASPETFRVEEIPAYPWCGTGEHAALRVEKAGLTTREVAAAVARSLGLPAQAVGYAGMKDKQAVTVQGFTVTGVATEHAVAAFVAAGCRVLEAGRHRNKLRLGHLAGNRFRTLLVGADSSACGEALQCLVGQGVPNYYGPQRFGARGDNAWSGQRLLRGEQRAKRWQYDLFTSALQSLVFNEVLARRLESGTLSTALAGDVLQREDSGGLFLCADPDVDTERARRLDVHPTGPMPGRKMVAPEGDVARSEDAVLADLGLEASLFTPLRGTRRGLRVRLEEAHVDDGPDGVWVEFTLPAGAFASVVVRELTGS